LEAQNDILQKPLDLQLDLRRLARWLRTTSSIKRTIERVKLNHFIKKELKKPVHSAVSLFNCCYSGEVVLEQIRRQDFVKSKKLYFYISLLGPFFAIHGIDSSTVILPVDAPRGESYQGNFATTHAITVSPVFEYAATFLQLEDTLREFFSGYYFIPFDIGISTIKNISIQDDLRDPRMIDTVYEGLFGQNSLHNCLSRGDERYGFVDWLKPLNEKEKKLNDEVSRHIINSPNKNTLHKVWKLNNYRRLETFKITGNLMANVPLFDVIDLTDETKAIIMEKDGRAFAETSYQLLDNKIHISDFYSLRIISLTQDSLILNVCIDLQSKETSLKGELIEGYYVEMKRLHDS
jgi:hypothetical protein